MNINSIKLIAFLLFIGLAFTQCSVKKRTYRDGYFISWNKKALLNTSDKPLKQIHSDLAIRKTTTLPPAQDNTGNPKALTASTDKTILKIQKPVKPLILKDTCGDMITMRNGQEIFGKVMEVSPKTVKYKRCDNLEGPLMVVNTNDVFMIQYVNGTKEVFKKDENQIQETKKYPDSQEQKKYNPAAITSFAGIFLSWIPFLVLIPFIFGIIALTQFKKQPDKFKGKWMASTGLIFSSIIIGIILIILLFALLMTI